MTTHTTDYGRYSDDYDRYRPGPPGSFYDRLERLRPITGCSVVDIGTGPGKTALELARRGANVVGIDVAANQIATAARRAHALGIADRCRFVVAPAESIPLADGCAEMVVASQCWHWLDHDRALAEVLRLLKPSGLFVVVYYCYLARIEGVAHDTEAMIARFNPNWDHLWSSGMFPEYVDSLQCDRLRLVEQFCYDVDHPFTHEAWRGRIRTCGGIGSGGLTDKGVAEFDAALATMLRQHHADEPMMIPHRVWAVILRRAS